MLYLNHKMNSKEEHIMKNIFIILGLLVVGMVFIGCPNPNVGSDDYIIDNNGNNGSENDNGENGGENNDENENGNSESNIYQLDTLTFNDLTFVIYYENATNNETVTVTPTDTENGTEKYKIEHTFNRIKPDGSEGTLKVQFLLKIINNVLSIEQTTSGYNYEVSRNGNTFTFTIN